MELEKVYSKIYSSTIIKTQERSLYMYSCCSILRQPPKTFRENQGRLILENQG
jgi:hypothetical protein